MSFVSWKNTNWVQRKNKDFAGIGRVKGGKD